MAAHLPPYAPMPRPRSVLFEAVLPNLPLTKRESRAPRREPRPKDELREQVARVREELKKLEAML